MEVKSNPGVANYLAEHFALEDLPEMGQAIQSLTEQPGWLLLMDMLEANATDAEELLKRHAHTAALSTDPNAAVEYARRLGVTTGKPWMAEAAETVLEKAKAAAEQLRNQARRDAAAEEVS